jgi:hypothetical protein
MNENLYAALKLGLRAIKTVEDLSIFSRIFNLLSTGLKCFSLESFVWSVKNTFITNM